MVARAFFRWIGVMGLPVLLIALVHSVSWGAPAGQPRTVKKPPILDICPEIIDPDLGTMQGRYDTYYFGMDIIINCTGSGPLCTVRPHPNLPPGTVVSPTGLSYKDSEVSYLGGIGRNSIYQAVQVTGDQKIVTGVVNLDILIPRSMTTGRPDLGLSGFGKGSLTGIKY